MKRVSTVSGKKLLHEVITTAYVFIPPKNGNKAEAVEVRALWDTGATHCQVTPELAKKMGLQSLGKLDCGTAGGSRISNLYQLGLVISREIYFRKLYFGESDGGGRFDIIIGMNALQVGTFTLEGEGERRTMRFEVE